MYLSCLDLDLEPTPRLTRLWLANPYRIHQRLCLAFREPGRVLDQSADEYVRDEVHVRCGERAPNES